MPGLPSQGSALVLQSSFPLFWNIGIVDQGLWVLSFRQEQHIQVATTFPALGEGPSRVTPPMLPWGNLRGCRSITSLGNPE